MKSDQKEREKFYRHLKAFLLVMGILIFFSVKNGTQFSVRPWMLLWGIGLAAHYLGVFGESCQANKPEPLEDPRTTEKDKWKNSDLV